MSADKDYRAGVSVQLGTSYMKAIPMNENVKIVSTVLRTGKQLATAEVRFYDKVRVVVFFITESSPVLSGKPELFSEIIRSDNKISIFRITCYVP